MSTQEKREKPWWDLAGLSNEEIEKRMKKQEEEDRLKRRESIAEDVVSRHGLTMEEALSEGAIDLDDLI